MFEQLTKENEERIFQIATIKICNATDSTVLSEKDLVFLKEMRTEYPKEVRSIWEEAENRLSK